MTTDPHPYSVFDGLRGAEIQRDDEAGVFPCDDSATRAALADLLIELRPLVRALRDMRTGGESSALRVRDAAAAFETHLRSVCGGFGDEECQA